MEPPHRHRSSAWNSCWRTLGRRQGCRILLCRTSDDLLNSELSPVDSKSYWSLSARIHFDLMECLLDESVHGGILLGVDHDFVWNVRSFAVNCDGRLGLSGLPNFSMGPKEIAIQRPHPTDTGTKDYVVTAHRISVVHSLPRWLPRTATWLYNLVRYLPPDISSHVVCETAENLAEFPVKNLHHLSASSKTVGWPRALMQKLRFESLVHRPYRNHLALVIKNHDAVILHSHWGDSACRDVLVAKRLGIAHVVTFYGKDVNFLPRHDYWFRQYQVLFENVDRVLCEGKHMAGCIAKLGCAESKIQVQRLGVEVNKIQFKPRIWCTGPLRILMAGSFREKKGFPDALEALGLLHHELNLEITIIGDSDSDPRSHPEKSRILRTIEKHQLASKTRLLGYQPHNILLNEAYQHHLFLSPSVTAADGDTEGGAPITLIEMAATGMPVVSTDHCDIPSIVIDGKTGLLARERDVPGLLRQLRWLVAHPGSWEGLANAARSHVEEEFDVRKQSSKLRDIYFSVSRKESRLGVRELAEA